MSLALRELQTETTVRFYFKKNKKKTNTVTYFGQNMGESESS